MPDTVFEVDIIGFVGLVFVFHYFKTFLEVIIFHPLSNENLQLVQEEKKKRKSANTAKYISACHRRRDERNCYR